MVTEVNLNNMLCPAASDPFSSSPHYRTLASFYLVPLSAGLGQLYIRYTGRQTVRILHFTCKMFFCQDLFLDQSEK